MKKFLSFSGKSSRQEFWGITILTSISFWIFLIIFGIIGDTIGINLLSIPIILIIPLYYLYLAVLTRRCNDVNLSKFWVIGAIFIPIIPIIIGCIKGDPQK